MGVTPGARWRSCGRGDTDGTSRPGETGRNERSCVEGVSGVDVDDEEGGRRTVPGSPFQSLKEYERSRRSSERDF